MTYVIRYTKYFLKQYDSLDSKSQRVVDSKISILKTNPFHYKSLHHYEYLLFRIRISVLRKEVRIVYLLSEKNIYLLGLLDRSRDYLDLQRLLQKAGFN